MTPPASSLSSSRLNLKKNGNGNSSGPPAPDPDGTAPRQRPRLLLITGLSGSGKSTAANAIEDLGYFCVDNLPLPMLRSLLDDPVAQTGGRDLIAVVTDVRAPGFAEAMPQLLAEVDERDFELVLLFLEASEEALLRRYSETRRAHPLAAGERPVIEGIRQERELLSDLRGAADRVLDTSNYSVHDVRREIYREFAGDDDGAGPTMTVSLVSFGFKHGIPAGSDLLFDVRYLPNPYFLPDLRDATGQDAAVQEFFDDHSEFHELIDRLLDLLLYLLPRYRAENRSYLTISVGCTGGRHRSVAIGERLQRLLRRDGFKVRLNHRDIGR